MKIRQGFVSNSSSTSFCIYGLALDNEKARKLFKLKEDEKVYNKLEETVSKVKDLEYHCGQDCYYHYIGRSWSNIKDEETGKQFKEDIQQKLKQIFNEDFKLSTYEEAWYNG